MATRCKDETEEVVRSFDPTGVTWYNLERNTGRHIPNNLGIAKATGSWIAYLGHDDIWSPRHLERFAALIEPNANRFVRGCIYYGPKDSETHFVTGMFDDAYLPSPISSPILPRPQRGVVDTIGGWRDPRSSARPSIAISSCARHTRDYDSTRRRKSPCTNSPRAYLYLGPMQTNSGLLSIGVHRIGSSLSDIIEKYRQQRKMLMTMWHHDFSGLKRSLFDDELQGPSTPRLEGASAVVMEQTELAGLGLVRLGGWESSVQVVHQFLGQNFDPLYAPGQVQITLCMPPLAVDSP